MKRVAFLFIALLSFQILNGQIAVGDWRDHFSYTEGLMVTSSSTRVYVSTTNGIFWYNSSDNSLGKLNKVNGLSDIGISAIGYSPFNDVLLVGYDNGNLDLVFEERIVNIPYIMEKPMQGSKQINHFNFIDQNQVLVSTGFGIVVVNTDKQEIKDTYYIGPGGTELNVNQTSVLNNRVFAATEQGLFSVDKDDPQIFHYQSWEIDTSLPDYTFGIAAVEGFNSTIVVAQSTGEYQPDNVFYHDGFSWQLITSAHYQVENLHSSSFGLVVCSRNAIEVYQDFQGSVSYIHSYPGYQHYYPNHAIFDRNGNIAVAESYYGLMYREAGEWTQVCPSGPSNNRAFHISPFNDDMIVASGARTDFWGNRWYPYAVHTFSNQQWSSKIYTDYFDAVRIIPNNLNHDEYFVASWGNGVGLFNKGELVEMFGPENSSLATIIPGPFCRISGLAQDNNGNLWVANGAVVNPISVRTAAGNWIGFPYQNQISSDRLSDIAISPNGFLWIIIPAGGGLFVLDPGENVESTSDDEHRKFKINDYEGNLLPNEIHSMAFDRDGYLWVGTNEGVLISYNPELVLEGNSFYAQRIKIPDVLEEYAVYLLDKEVITSIAVDGGNRKWFGTARSGIYLQSADGLNQIYHFSKENSPLPSNMIQHIAIHPKTGEVFIATDKGVVSFRGEATEPSVAFGKVYAFPNPVRPNYDGIITITGLVDKTNVKITDVAGNLVYETQSQGGQATWDGKNFSGKRVSTGVYLFFCTESTGQQSAVGKLLFVK